ncbi:carotenoid oxygenase family protein [Kitasatospora sp. NPDC059795]|uniref:carotenoid oxygenase family protein n=1 Tax=Kitasatospora sp. NPDC059795 TaxID=3346949 RepID=UPI00366449B2
MSRCPSAGRGRRARPAPGRAGRWLRRRSATALPSAGSPAATDRSELLVLDTTDFTGPPLATVPLPGWVPHGFHAQWVPAKW